MSVCLIITEPWLEETTHPDFKLHLFRNSSLKTFKQLKDTKKKSWSAMMILTLNILVLLLSEAVLASVLTSSLRACPTCKGKQVAADESITALPLGDPCGIYTLKCAHGLRCEPPQDEPRPLRALLEGRGVCSNVSTTSTISTTTQVQTEGKKPLCLEG